MKTESRCLEPKDTAPDRRAATGCRPIAVFALTNTPILVQGLKAVGHALSRQLSISACIFDLNSVDVPWGDSHPDVVLLDMYMGPEKVLPWLKHWQPHSPFKVLLLSRNPDDGLLEQALMAGARGHLDHRASLDTLLRAIEKVHQGEIWVERKATTRLLKNWIKREQSMPQEDLTQMLTDLTVREYNILAALITHDDEPAKAIAAWLHISESTLRNHLTSIYNKMGVRNRHGLASLARRSGLAQRLKA